MALNQFSISPLLQTFFQNWDTLRVEVIYKMVTRVIQYFCFPDGPMKGGNILDFYKGGNFRNRGGGGDLEKGVWPPLPIMSKSKKERRNRKKERKEWHETKKKGSTTKWR